MAMAKGFNKNVTHIQNNDNHLLVTFKFNGKQIYNLDETGYDNRSQQAFIQQTS
jgi:hypothetical protein